MFYSSSLPSCISGKCNGSVRLGNVYAAAISYLHSLECGAAVLPHLCPALSKRYRVFPSNAAAAQEQLVSAPSQFCHPKQTVVCQQLQQEECTLFLPVNLVKELAIS